MPQAYRHIHMFSSDEIQAAVVEPEPCDSSTTMREIRAIEVNTRGVSTRQVVINHRASHFKDKQKREEHPLTRSLSVVGRKERAEDENVLPSGALRQCACVSVAGGLHSRPGGNTLMLVHSSHPNANECTWKS